MNPPGGVDVVPVCDAFGAEVRGLSLREELSVDSTALLRELFDTHHLLLFRDQDFTGDDQLRVCRALRPVADPVAWVSNVEAGFHPESELLFHSDFAFTPDPMLGLSLYAVELGDGAAPTRFASNVRACAALAEEVRERLRGLDVVHVVDSVKGRDNRRTRLDDVGGTDAPRNVFPRFSRPAIWTHPVIGVPLLFVLQQQASHFEGWSCHDSDELIDASFAALYHPANVHEHHWRVGDFVVWDNLALQHGRPANPITVRRSLRRVAMNVVTTGELIAGTGFDPVERAKRAAAAAP
jgi:taurine dioxygenase